jgi:hypothetical protein
VQAGHQPDGDGRAPIVGAIQGAEFRRQRVPRDHGREAHQFVVHVQGQVEAHGRDQGLFVGSGLGFGLHRYTGKWGLVPIFLCTRYLKSSLKLLNFLIDVPYSGATN